VSHLITKLAQKSGDFIIIIKESSSIFDVNVERLVGTSGKSHAAAIILIIASGMYRSFHERSAVSRKGELLLGSRVGWQLNFEVGGVLAGDERDVVARYLQRLLPRHFSGAQVTQAPWEDRKRVGSSLPYGSSIMPTL